MKPVHSKNNSGADETAEPQRRFTVSLFWRIFLMVWLAMALTLGAGQLVSRLLVAQEQQAMTRQLGLYELGQEVLALSQNGGADAVRQFCASKAEPWACT
jgi:two-component system OmpR family sensor kinase